MAVRHLFARFYNAQQEDYYATETAEKYQCRCLRKFHVHRLNYIHHSCLPII